MAKQLRHPKTALSTVSRGKMLERLVASMHEQEGVKVERNVRLPPIGGEGSKREIDILLSSEVCGYPMRLAIECKNEGKKTGAPYIDAFVGKLSYVGIPPQLGIFVSVAGYTKGAIERARAAGVKLFLFEDALRNIDAAIAQAVQTIIYLLPILGTITVQNFVADPMPASEIQLFYNSEGDVCGSLPDAIWRMWLDGAIPPIIGEHDIVFEAPEGIYHRYGDKLAPVTKITVNVQIIGIVQQLVGILSAGSLLNAENGKIERQKIKAQFVPPPPGRYQLKTITSEEQLQQEYANKALFEITNRIRLPRINYWNMLYYPPSDRVSAYVVERMRAFESGLIPDPRPFNMSELEGSDLATIFEQPGKAR